MLLIFVCSEIPASAASVRKQSKPLPPLIVTIAPVNQQLSARDIKPGETVDFSVTVVPDVDAESMSIKIHLTGGAKLISGDLSWTGPAVKNRPITIPLTVQAPENGTGRIKAQASIAPSDGTHFSSEAQLTLGPEPQAKPQQEGVITKDKAGKDVIEYR